ncbi:hypothetical protein ABZY90_13625 [Streptomyces sp. NPDC006422]|uniref:hypothetical protein n=1 Tax=unclassified Streptomyces TaxID=2593676 RepID=UPI0033A7B526
MKRVRMCAVMVLAGSLLTACSEAEPDLHPTRSPAEGAWYESSRADRREYCEAYRAHDPQRPVMIPAYPSEQTRDEFADDFYAVLKKKC